MIVPLSLNGSIIRSLDLEMAGAPRDEVRRMLCEELLVDNDNYTSRWVLVDLEDPSAPTASPLVRTTPTSPQAVHATSSSATGSRGPAWWPARPRDRHVRHSAGDPLEMDARGWNRSIVAPVFVRDRLVAAFLLLGRVPLEYPADYVKVNVAIRVQTLVTRHGAALGAMGGSGPPRAGRVDRRR